MTFILQVRLFKTLLESYANNKAAQSSRRGIHITFSGATRVFEQSKRVECFPTAKMERR